MKRHEIWNEIAKEIHKFGTGVTYNVTTLVFDGEYTAFLHDKNHDDLTIIQENPEGFSKTYLVSKEIKALKAFL